MKLLNLDAIQNVTRQVQLFGAFYTLERQSVGGLIESLQLQESATKDDDKEMFLSMVRTVKCLLPTAPESEIHKLSFEQLRALLEFANAADESLADSSNDEGDATKK